MKKYRKIKLFHFEGWEGTEWLNTCNKPGRIIRTCYKNWEKMSPTVSSSFMSVKDWFYCSQVREIIKENKHAPPGKRVILLSQPFNTKDENINIYHTFFFTGFFVSCRQWDFRRKWIFFKETYEQTLMISAWEKMNAIALCSHIYKTQLKTRNWTARSQPFFFRFVDLTEKINQFTFLWRDNFLKNRDDSQIFEK